MEKSKKYSNIVFTANVIEEAHTKFFKIANKHLKGDIKKEIPQALQISIKDETWDFDHFEEFLSMVDESSESYIDHIIGNSRFYVRTYSSYMFRSSVSVKFPERFNIESVFNIFEKNIEKCKIVDEAKIEELTLFIGHGKNKQWRDLKDHLTEKHGFKVICYEIVVNTGETIKDTLETMLYECNFALLVFTGEDFDIKGIPHARENVIHELGLFQGRLGFDNAMILLEEDVKEFTNIVGINQLRFSKGKINEIFGDIVSILNKKISD